MIIHGCMRRAKLLCQPHDDDENLIENAPSVCVFFFLQREKEREDDLELKCFPGATNFNVDFLTCYYYMRERLLCKRVIDARFI